MKNLFNFLIIGALFISIFLISLTSCDKDNPAEPEAEPILKINPGQLYFTREVDCDTLKITNDGGKELSWHISQKPDWMVVSRDSGSITTEQDEIIVTADLSLGVGDYSGELRITSNGGKKTVPSYMKIEGLGLIRKWNLFTGTYNGNVLDNLSGYYNFEESGTYSARIEKDSNRGSISGCAFTKSGSSSGTIKFDSPSQILLNGMTGGYTVGPNGGIQNYWSSNISFSRSAFTQYGGTGLGWPPTENFKFTISGDTLTISKSDESTILKYLADAE